MQFSESKEHHNAFNLESCFPHLCLPLGLSWTFFSMTFALVPGHMKGRKAFKQPQLESLRVTTFCIKVEMKPNISNAGFQRARRLMGTASHLSSKQWKYIIYISNALNHESQNSIWHWALFVFTARQCFVLVVVFPKMSPDGVHLKKPTASWGGKKQILGWV